MSTCYFIYQHWDNYTPLAKYILTIHSKFILGPIISVRTRHSEMFFFAFGVLYKSQPNKNNQIQVILLPHF